MRIKGNHNSMARSVIKTSFFASVLTGEGFTGRGGCSGGIIEFCICV